MSSANSLVGSSPNDRLRLFDVTILPNDNYIVHTTDWDDPLTELVDAGAVVWCSGTSGCQGSISAANAHIGTQASTGLFTYVLENSNYLVLGNWNDPATPEDERRAVRLCAGIRGCQGGFSATNTLTGDFYRAEPLASGNYALLSGAGSDGQAGINWAEAITICDGVTGCQGAVNLSNSFLMRTAGDLNLSTSIVTPLEDGHYAIALPDWDDPSTGITNVGAVAWCDLAITCAGWVDATTALIGTTANDQLGRRVFDDDRSRYIPGVLALENGNYVVRGTQWSDPQTGALGVGAITWCDGATGCRGTINASNSLIGTSANDRLGDTDLVGLPNGNYVAASYGWDLPNGPADVGAVTWCDGTIGCRGTINAGNSLLGPSANDLVGRWVEVLTNGNYVVSSPSWDDPARGITNVGAVTWCDDALGCVGLVDSSNSLVGSVANELLGGQQQVFVEAGEYYLYPPAIRLLSTGDYLVIDFGWRDPADPTTPLGVLTFGVGTQRTAGELLDAGVVTITGPLLETKPYELNADLHLIVVPRPQLNIVSVLSFAPPPPPTATPTATDIPTATPTTTATATDIPTATPTDTAIPTSTTTATPIPGFAADQVQIGRNGNVVQLSWPALRQWLIREYRILRSSTGLLANAQEVGVIAVVGNSPAVMTNMLTWSDNNAPAGALTYWIVAIDQSGGVVARSEAIQIGSAEPGAAPMRIYLPLLRSR